MKGKRETRGKVKRKGEVKEKPDGHTNGTNYF